MTMLRVTACTLAAVIGTLIATVPAAAQRSTWYPNCTAARAAGAAPLYRGDPGYATHLDRDRDGVACETGRGSGSGRAARRKRRR